MKKLIILTAIISSISQAKEIVQIKRTNTQFIKDSNFSESVAVLKKEPKKRWTIYLSNSYNKLSSKEQDKIITHFMNIALKSN